MSVRGFTPDDEDDRHAIRVYNHDDGDIVMYDVENPNAFIKIGAGEVFELDAEVLR